MKVEVANPVADASAPADFGGAAPDAYQRSERLRYIDGLRAVAIIAVVAFHAKLPGFSGGFTGVDVFFVISGFLITRQIAAEALAGRFSAADFYARRMTRILPPLLLVALAVIACDRFFPLLASERRDIDLSAAAAAAMVSNYYFAAGTEYFSRASEIEPFLHTWSLGVEEQYYVFAPFVIGATIYLAARRKRSAPRVLLAVAGAALVVSWAIGAILTYYDHKVAFYSLVSRAWQFAAGAALAVAVLDGLVLPSAMRRAAGAFGALALAAAFLLLDRDTPYPGLAAALPTLGATLLIACGIGGEEFLTRALASRPAVAIGAVSYGWYLWHWPALSFARSLDLAPSTLWRDLAACAAASRPGGCHLRAGRTADENASRAAHGYAACPDHHRPGALRVGSGCGSHISGLAWCGAHPAIGGGTERPSRIGVRRLRRRRIDARVPDGFSCRVGPPGAPGTLLWGDLHALTYSKLAETLATTAGHPAPRGRRLGMPTLAGGRRGDQRAAEMLGYRRGDFSLDRFATGQVRDRCRARRPVAGL